MVRVQVRVLVRGVEKGSGVVKLVQVLAREELLYLQSSPVGERSAYLPDYRYGRTTDYSGIAD